MLLRDHLVQLGLSRWGEAEDQDHPFIGSEAGAAPASNSARARGWTLPESRTVARSSIGVRMRGEVCAYSVKERNSVPNRHGSFIHWAHRRGGPLDRANLVLLLGVVCRWYVRGLECPHEARLTHLLCDGGLRGGFRSAGDSKFERRLERERLPGSTCAAMTPI